MPHAALAAAFTLGGCSPPPPSTEPPPAPPSEPFEPEEPSVCGAPEEPTGRCATYRIEAVVDTPEGEVRAARTWSVCQIEVSIPLGEGKSLTGLEHRRDAEALWLDLGARGQAVVLLRDDYNQEFPNRVLLEAAARGGDPFAVPAGTRFELAPHWWPIVVQFPDPSDPVSVVEVYRVGTGSLSQRVGRPPEVDRFEELFGAGVRLRSVAVEFTEAAPEPPELHQHLPFLAELPFEVSRARFGRHLLRRSDLRSTRFESVAAPPPPALAGPPATVTTHAVGDLPRRALAFTPPPGPAASSRWRTEEQGTFAVEGAVRGQIVPPSAERFVVDRTVRRVVEAAPAGKPLTIGLTLAFDAAEGAPALDLRRKRSVPRPVTPGPLPPPLTVGLRVDPRSGEVCAIDPRYDRRAEDALRGVLGQWRALMPQFPRRPLGAGARWTVERDLLIGEVVLRVEQTWSITGMEGDRVSLSVEQEATLRTAPAPGRGHVGVGTFTGVGSGALEVDLATLAVRGSIETTWDVGDSAPDGSVRWTLHVVQTETWSDAS